MSFHRPVPSRNMILAPAPAKYAVILATACAALIATTSTAEAKSYKGAEVYSPKSYLYGRVEVRMRTIRGNGLVSSFFTYKNGSEVSGTLWEEIDIEIMGKNDAKSWQSNICTGNPRTTSEQVYTSPTSLADDYHTYTMEWAPDYVLWLFDGKQMRKTQGGQASSLTNPQSLRFNAWISDASGWVGTFEEKALPAHQFVNWIKYYRYDDGQFVLDWTDDFDTLDPTRWSKGNWTFDGNLVDFDIENALVKEGALILAITKQGETGFAGRVPYDPEGGAGDPSTVTTPSDAGATPSPPADSGCSVLGTGHGGHAAGLGILGALLTLAWVLGRRPRRAR